MQNNSSTFVDIFAHTPPETMERCIVGEGRKSSLLNSDRKEFKDVEDDTDGYFNFTVSEVIDCRYEVFAGHGRGVFSTVLRAFDLDNPIRTYPANTFTEVAIKVIRNNITMTKGAQLERIILNKLALSDTKNKYHVIQLVGHFEHRNHVCLVFEPMNMNLRSCVKKFGRDIGLNIYAVRAYSIQLLIALKHLKNNGVLHADIKPDNILVNDTRTIVKLCDFGSAMFSGHHEVTPYLVSRYYRAPEVILSLQYDNALDMWSIGCVIYELFTGKILFPGKTNNEMIKLMMAVKGTFPKKMLRKGALADRHFDLTHPTAPFRDIEEDPVTKKTVRRASSNSYAKQGFSQRLSPTHSDRTKVLQLMNLLEKIMMLDPEKRLTPNQALKHSFVT